MWWTCKKARKYWIQLYEEIQKIVQLKFVMGSKRMLLNILPSDITKIHRELFKYIATRVIFAANWKRVKCPDLKEWKNKYVTLAKLIYRILGISKLHPADQNCAAHSFDLACSSPLPSTCTHPLKLKLLLTAGSRGWGCWTFQLSPLHLCLLLLHLEPPLGSMQHMKGCKENMEWIFH